jgi:hypothetical protein
MTPGGADLEARQAWKDSQSFRARLGPAASLGGRNGKKQT